MKKYVLIILSIVATPAYAMKIEVEESVSKPFKSCWFLILPVEVRDLIADLLFYHLEETKQEFIERTKKYYLECLPHCNRNPNPYCIFYLTADCPDKLLRAEIEKSEGVLPTLRVMDTTKDYKRLHFDRRGDLYGHTNIAISRHGNMFAVVHKIPDNSNNSRCDVLHDKTVLSVKNMISQEIRYYDLPYHFAVSDKHAGIAFNKQGTHVILHGCDYHQVPSGTPLHDLAEKAPHHIIIPLTNYVPNPKNSEKTLTSYVKQLTLTQ